MTRRGRPRHPDILTPREWDVLALLREERSNDEIAQRLGISLATVKFHVSEILGKLEVPTRAEAARWQPDTASGRGTAADREQRRFWLTAPLALFRRGSSGASAGARIAAGGVLAVALAGVALLAWGVLASRGSGGADTAAAAWRTERGGDPNIASVVLFDLQQRVVRRVPMTSDLAYAYWLHEDQTLVGATGDGGYRVFGLDGVATGESVASDPVAVGAGAIVPAPDGSTVLLERTDLQYVSTDLRTGAETSTFLASARDLAFSPDGQHVAYSTIGGSDKENTVHDFTSIMVATKDGVSGFKGSAGAVQFQREADGSLALLPEPWSPDSTYLLAQRVLPCAPTCAKDPVFEVYGTQETGRVIWSKYQHQLASAQWAGPGRLFVTFKPDGQRDPDFPDASALYVDLGLQKQPAPAAISDALTTPGVLSFSPDGRTAIIERNPREYGQRRCSLVDTTTGAEIAGIDESAGDADHVFCSVVSWSADGTHVLVSASGI